MSGPLCIVPLKTLLQLNRALAATEGFLEASVEKVSGAAVLIEDHIHPSLDAIEDVFTPVGADVE